jgi:Fe-Mn family superoxide dismutase
MEAKEFKEKSFLSERQFQEHLKLYNGYIKKAEEVGEKLKNSSFDDANATFSETRSLRLAETFSINGVKLHELYFDNLGKTEKEGKVVDAIIEKWGDFERFKKSFIASALSVRGWVILAWDNDMKKLKMYATDQHDIAVWNATPLLVLDVYEHAYFIDFGTDRKKYVETFFENINWGVVNERLEKN